MNSFKMYEVVEVVNPGHPRHGTRGVIAGAFVIDGEVMSYSVHFADDIEMVDPEDLEQTNQHISQADYEHGTWPPACLTKG